MSEENLSAAQLRARKRQEKIKASASSRINKVVGTARGEEGADYLKTDTPFSRPTPVADPDDVDISLSSVSRTAAAPQPELPDLLSMLNAPPGDLPPDMADNPLFAMMQNMTGAGAGPAGPTAPPRPRTLLERLLPLAHLLSSVALVAWAVWNASHLTEWHALPKRPSTLEALQSAAGLYKPMSLVYAFITTQLVLQTIQLTLAKSNPPPPTMLDQVLPLLPPPFNTYIAALVKYYALAGTVLDDLAVVLVGIGLVIAWHAR